MVKNNHETLAIRNWKKRGLILKENQTYKDIYSYVMSIERCERCGINFDNEIHNNRRCMDHNHKTGFFRQVLCMKCNKVFDRKSIDIYSSKSRTGHLWISPNVSKNINGTYSVGFRYERKGFKRKQFKCLKNAIAYSFLNLLKESI